MDKFIAFLSGLVGQIVDEKLGVFRKKLLKAYMIHVGLLSILMFLVSLAASYLVFAINSGVSLSLNIEDSSIVYISLGLMAFFTGLNFFFLRKTSTDMPHQTDFSDIFENLTDMITEVSETFKNEENLKLKRENDLLRNEIIELKRDVENFDFEISKKNNEDLSSNDES